MAENRRTNDGQKNAPPLVGPSKGQVPVSSQVDYPNTLRQLVARFQGGMDSHEVADLKHDIGLCISRMEVALANKNAANETSQD